MRPFKSYATRWPISVLCILSFGLTLTTTVMFTQPVNAQIGISQVAVIDFRNSSKMPGQGRRARGRNLPTWRWRWARPDP